MRAHAVAVFMVWGLMHLCVRVQAQENGCQDLLLEQGAALFLGVCRCWPVM